MTVPALRLAYLYVGSDDVARDTRWYRDALGAEIVWAFDRFGAVVAALRVGEGPLLLLADHRPAGECRSIYAVDDLESALAEVRRAGTTRIVEVGVPPGPCAIFDDPSGNPVGLIEETRPGRMELGFCDPENRAVLRPPWPRVRRHAPPIDASARGKSRVGECDKKNAADFGSTNFGGNE